MSEWLFLSVWVLAMVLACAGYVALQKMRGARHPASGLLTLAITVLVAIIVIAPLFFLFMPASAL